MLRLADWVSLSRIPLAVLIVLLLQNKWLVVLLFAIALITDWLDGFLAKKGRRDGTPFGAFIDPFTDKIFVLIVGIVLLKEFDWYYIFLFFSRDIFTVLAAGLCHGFGLKGVKARTFGKMVTISQFVTLLLVFLKFQYSEFLISLIGILTALAIIEYVWWFRHEVARV